MKYTVILEPSEEGFSVSVPGLPGCHSQGSTRDEALANIADAIRDYLDAAQELKQNANTGWLKSISHEERDELDRRLKLLSANPSNVVTWEKVKERTLARFDK